MSKIEKNSVPAPLPRKILNDIKFYAGALFSFFSKKVAKSYGRESIPLFFYRHTKIQQVFEHLLSEDEVNRSIGDEHNEIWNSQTQHHKGKSFDFVRHLCLNMDSRREAKKHFRHEKEDCGEEYGIKNDAVVEPFIVSGSGQLDEEPIQSIKEAHNDASTGRCNDNLKEGVKCYETVKRNIERNISEHEGKQKRIQHGLIIFRCKFFKRFNKFFNQIVHGGSNFDDTAKLVKIISYPCKVAKNFGDANYFSRGDNFFSIFSSKKFGSSDLIKT